MWSKWRGHWAWINLSSGFDDLSQRPVQQCAPDIRRAIYTTNRKRFASGRVRNFSRFATRSPLLSLHALLRTDTRFYSTGAGNT
jgi:hypothetical protein